MIFPGSKRYLWGFRVIVGLFLICVAMPGISDAQGNGKPPTVAAVPEIVAAPKDLAELKELESRIKQAVSKVVPSVVGVKIGTAGGSAVIVKEDGLMLTAGHVVGKPKQKVVVFFADGKTANGTTLGTYKSADAGMMQITDKGKWPFVEVGNSDDLRQGQWCFAVGHPFGFMTGRPPVVRVGRILGSTRTTIQTDCPLISGDSGGPLFDLDGKIIGINSRIGGKTTQNYHVPVDVFHENWERLAKGDAWQVDAPTRDGSPVKHAFREVVSDVGRCVVRIKCDGKDRALGTIVGPDGWVLTKASEVNGKKILCRFRDKKELEARVVGIDEQHDLVMLKVDAAGLPAIEWNTSVPDVGTWVATAGLSDDPLTVGAVSVAVREIPRVPPKLGVAITDGKQGPEIVRVFPGTGGERAGLKTKDVITHVDGKEVKKRDDVTNLIRKYKIGDTIQLKVQRGDKSMDLSAKLAKIENDATKRRDMMNASNVGVSKRRDSFPAVMQHDTVLKPADCGGPLVDLSGKVVGMNIARGGRTETYCIPSSVLLARMYDLMSGRLAPAAKEEEKPAEAAKTEDQPEKKPEAEKKPDPEKKPESEKDPEPKKEPEAEKKSDPAPEKKPDTEKKPESAKEPEPKKEPEVEKKPEPAPEKKPDKQEKPNENGKPEPDKTPEAKPPGAADGAEKETPGENNGEAAPEEEPKSDEGKSPSDGDAAQPSPNGQPTPDGAPQPESQPEPAK